MAITKKTSNFVVMKELVKHIEILLLSKDCVIVPNFGGFVAHHVPAHYEENDCLYYPPLRTIGFNPQLKLNDSLLVQSYVDAYEMSYPDALNRIEDEVNEIRKQIENEGGLEMEGLGSFKMNHDGNLVFEPCLAGILTPSLYGLASYEVENLQQNMATANHVELTDSLKTIPESTTTKERIKAAHVSMNWVRNAAVACALAFAVFMIPQMKFDSNNATSNVNTSLLSRIMPKDIVNGTPELSINGVSESETCAMSLMNLPSFVKNTGKPDLLFVSEDSSKPYYSIILASHVTINNAIEFVNQLHALGYEEAKILTKGATKVLYGQFETKEEAYETLIPLKETDGNFTDAWVMKVEF